MLVEMWCGKKWIVIIGFLMSLQVEAQTALIEVKTQYGILMVNKADDALAVYGTMKIDASTYAELTKQGLQNHKGKIKLILNKNCQIADIVLREAFPNGQVNAALKEFITELKSKIASKQYADLFQLNNDLGFVNEDNCVDNINASIAFVAN